MTGERRSPESLGAGGLGWTWEWGCIWGKTECENGNRLKLCEAFIPVILPIPNHCKADSVFFLQVGKLRLRETPWLARVTQPDVESRSETSLFFLYPVG